MLKFLFVLLSKLRAADGARGGKLYSKSFLKIKLYTVFQSQVEYNLQLNEKEADEIEPEILKAKEAAVSWLERETRLLPETAGSFSALLGTDFKNEKPKEGILAVTITMADGGNRCVSRKIRIAPHSYPAENIKVERTRLKPSKELAERIERTTRLGRAALLSNTPGHAPKLPPVRTVPGMLTSVYGKSRYFHGEFRGRHGGVDMWARDGAPVRAAADGVVVLVGSF